MQVMDTLDVTRKRDVDLESSASSGDEVNVLRMSDFLVGWLSHNLEFVH